MKPQILGIKYTKIAKWWHERHHSSILVRDICTWETTKKFDFILAWDSIFHLPFSMQEPVVTKLCKMLVENGVLVYTFGDGCGEHTDEWHSEQFYYSSIGINGNLSVLMKNQMVCKHLELDQFPENHVYLVAQKT